MSTSSCSRAPTRSTTRRPSAARDGLLDELGFAKYLGYRVEELSGGTRQKLNLALALLHEPAAAAARRALRRL